MSSFVSCDRAELPKAHAPITVLVTGVSGYIGAHVAKQAVEAGFTVKGSVRSHTHDEMLKAVLPDVELVELDLRGSVEEFAACFKGSRYICHVASPFPGGQVTTEEMKAAVEGTKKVVAAAKLAGVEKLVVTSSVAAVSANREDKGNTRDNPFTPEDWTNLEGLTSSYSESKTKAEQAARALAAEEPTLKLITVHPSYVQGPMLLPRTPTSAAMGKRILEGDMPAVAPIGMSVCHVSDVAAAHVAAMSSTDVVAGTRFIVAAGNILMTDLANKAKERFAEWPVKTMRAPYALIWLYSFIDSQAAAVLPMWEKTIYYDCSATEALLGRPLRDPMESCLEMMQSLVDHGVAKKN